MGSYLLLATSNGLAIAEEKEQGWRLQTTSLPGEHVTSVIARENTILAGTRRGVYRSGDLGQTWEPCNTGLTWRHVRWMAYHPEISDFELVGSEPAGIFISQDGATIWGECPEITGWREKFGWFLPYSPEAGCVRGFAIHGQRAYAAVEVGGVLISQDGGKSWQLAPGSRGDTDLHPAPGFIHPDVHSIEVHPSSPQLVYAPTGGGFYRSNDGGSTWRHLYADCYCRAAWVDPADPEHVLLGPAEGVDYHGRIEESTDGGLSWHLASPGLQVPWPRTMVERFFQAEENLMAVLSNGEVLVSPLLDWAWQPLLPDVVRVNAIAKLYV